MYVRALRAVSVCACASRVKGRRSSPSEQGLTIVESCGLRRRSHFQYTAINLVRRSRKRRSKSLADKGTMAANMYRVGGNVRECVRAGVTKDSSCDRLSICQ